MNIKALPYKAPIKVSENSIFLYDTAQKYYIWNRSTLEEICSHDFSGEFVNVRNLGDGFVFNLPKKEEGFIYEEGSKKLSKIITDYSLYAKLEGGKYIGTHKKEVKYHLLDSKFESIQSFDRIDDVYYTLICNQGFVDYSRNKGETHLLRLRNPLTNEITYNYELPNRGSSHEYSDPYFLLSVEGKSEWSIYCFDLEKKELIGTLNFKGLPRYIIDENSKTVVICSNFRYFEVKLDTFEIVNEFVLEREREAMRPEVMRYLTKDGIFFYCNGKEQKLGKINRQTGVVDWEHDYKPENNERLNIYFWEKVLEEEYLIHILDNNFPRLVLMKE